MKKLRSLFSNMFGKNKEISQKPLTKLSIFFVIVFDIFLFSNILDGYVYQGNLVKNPNELHQCKNLFTYETVQSEYFVERLSSYISYDKRYQDSTYCDKISGFISEDFKNTITSLNDKMDSIQQEIRRKQFELNDYDYEYKKYLEENRSGINTFDDRLSGIEGGNARAEYNSLNQELNLLKQERQNILSEIYSTEDFQNITTFIEKNKDEFNKVFEKQIFWYPVKVGFFQTILLFPLFLLSLFFYKTSLSKRNKIFTILFANLTFITGIFLFVLLFKFLYYFLPKKFFIDLIATLKMLNIGFIWNYILVFLGIIIFGFIIYFSQKGSEKLQKMREENEQRRIAENKVKISKERYFKNECIDCGKTLLKDSKYCSHCGSDQYHTCTTCQKDFPKSFEYCNHCGTEK